FDDPRENTHCLKLVHDSAKVLQRCRHHPPATVNPRCHVYEVFFNFEDQIKIDGQARVSQMQRIAAR
ncbi:hypothetical protein SCB29_39325, partial [Paraburkholderia sp. SIMBA_055]